MEGDNQQVVVKMGFNFVHYFWRRQYRWFCLRKSYNECIVIWWNYKKPMLIGIIDNKWVYTNVYIRNPVTLKQWFVNIWILQTDTMDIITSYYNFSQSDLIQPQGNRYY